MMRAALDEALTAAKRDRSVAWFAIAAIVSDNTKAAPAARWPGPTADGSLRRIDLRCHLRASARPPPAISHFRGSRELEVCFSQNVISSRA